MMSPPLPFAAPVCCLLPTGDSNPSGEAVVELFGAVHVGEAPADEEAGEDDAARRCRRDVF